MQAQQKFKTKKDYYNRAGDIDNLQQAYNLKNNAANNNNNCYSNK